MCFNARARLDEVRIGVFGKGGAGKSTAVVLLAKALRKRGYDVYILDADSTNLGSHLGLGLEYCPAPLIDYFGGMVFSGGRVTCPVDDPTLLDGAEISLEDLPTPYWARNEEGIYYLVIGKLGLQGPGAGCDGPFSKIARDLKVRGAAGGGVTLVDFKAGLEDTVRGALTSLDWAIHIVDPTTTSLEMVPEMVEMVDRIRAGTPPATEHLGSRELVELAKTIFREARIKGVLVVLNRVPDAEVERHMRRALDDNQIVPIGVIHEDPSLSLSWLRGTPLEPRGTRREVEEIIDALETVVQGVSTDEGRVLMGR
jgi:CO dehydrogenase nickel-insertion accessory protein CooC1